MLEKNQLDKKAHDQIKFVFVQSHDSSIIIRSND